jgi:hypothetical protein
LAITSGHSQQTRGKAEKQLDEVPMHEAILAYSPRGTKVVPESKQYLATLAE